MASCVYLVILKGGRGLCEDAWKEGVREGERGNGGRKPTTFLTLMI